MQNPFATIGPELCIVLAFLNLFEGRLNTSIQSFYRPSSLNFYYSCALVALVKDHEVEKASSCFPIGEHLVA